MEVVTDFISGVKRLYHGYLWTLTLADPRVEGWLLMGSPIPTVALVFLYLAFVYLGPQFMKNREPYKLKWTLILYNMGVTFLNLYIAVELFYGATVLSYSWICQPVSRIDSPEEYRIASALWWYYFSKCIEFTDTAFFILRKKNNQLTFLHVYHHSTMFFLWWIGIKWVPGGSSFIAAGLNSIVHVLMYSYYGLSALGPSVQKYLWWKKYLTIIQLIQFTIALVLGINALRIQCDFPKWMQWALIAYMLSFIVLFSNFYHHAYSKKKRYASSKKCDDALTNGNVANGSSIFQKNGFIKNGLNKNGLVMNGLLMNGLSNGHALHNGVPNGHADLRNRVITK